MNVNVTAEIVPNGILRLGLFSSPLIFAPAIIPENLREKKNRQFDESNIK